MNNAMVEFKFEANPVRIVKKGEDFFFVAKDVGEALGIVNIANTVLDYEPDEKGIELVDTLGGQQSMIVLSEMGLYRLIMRSDKPDARKFQRWVTHEVLPSIRKTGGYYVKPMTLGEQLLLQAQMMVESERKAAESLALSMRTAVKVEELDCKGQLAIEKADKAFMRAEGNIGHFSVMGFARLHNKNISIGKASALGRKMTKFCQGLGIKTETISDPRFGFVNTYPQPALEEYFAEHGWN